MPLVVVPSWTIPFDVPQVNLLRAATGFALVFAAVRWGLLRLSSTPSTRLAPSVRWTLAAFVAVLVLSTAFSISPEVSFWGSLPDFHGTSALNLLTFVAIALVVGSALWRPTQRTRVAAYLAAGGTLVSMYGIAQFVGADPLGLSPPGRRIISTLGNPIFVGDLLVVTTPLTAALAAASAAGFASQRSPAAGARAVVSSLALVAQLGAMLLTQSRGPFLGLAVAVFVALVVLARGAGLRRAGVLGAVVLIALAVAVASVRALPGGQGTQSLGENVQRVASAGEFAAGALPAGEPGAAARPEVNADSFQSRLRTWELAWTQALRRPWVDFAPAAPYPVRALFGYGPDTSRIVNRMGAPVELLRLHPGQISYYMHNLPLQVLSDLGWIGVACAVALLAAVLRQIWRSLQITRSLSVSPEVPDSWILAATAGAIAGHLAEQFTGVPVAAADAAFWIVVGIACGLARPAAGMRRASHLRWQLPTLAALPGIALITVAGMSVAAEVRAAAALRELDGGRLAAAERMLREAASTAPWPPYYQLLMAVTYANAAPMMADPAAAGRVASLAGQYLDSVLRQDPWNVTARSARAWTHTVLGAHDPSQRAAAERHYRELFTLAPAFDEPDLQYASALIVWGQPADALRHLDGNVRGTSADFRDPDEVRARAQAALAATSTAP